MLIDNIPVFCEDKGKKVFLDETKPYNFLIEVKNYLFLERKTKCREIYF